MLLIEEASALDLTIKGSVGQFAVSSGRPGGKPSVHVQYLQTHLGFALGGEGEEKLLQNLRPVREVFNIAELEFDELMQRDIDDGRVSSELIPYLLHDQAKVIVKLFPPIIVVVLPTTELGRPATEYPSTVTLQEHDEKNNIDWSVTRSGAVGAEAFEFRQVLRAGVAQEHDYAQLKLNTSKCRLAIVDGQHRAMALLALYRNVKGWPADARKYQEYYQRWARSEVVKYDLSRVRLPLLLITFPELDGTDKRGPKVTEACRSVFLALNKNAKPVSRARNYLLDDSDAIAHFLRATLREVKSQDDASQLALQIWNVELDASADRRRLSNTVAITGVMHLYSVIEFLMLNKKTFKKDSLSHPRQNLWKQKDLSDCIRRLDAKALLGADRTASATRYYCEDDTLELLAKRFLDRYGTSIIRVLDEFAPYRAISDAANRLEKKLSSEPNGAMYHAILFEGQGQGQVFDDYVEKLKSIRAELTVVSKKVPPRLEASYEAFERRKEELDDIRTRFEVWRNVAYVGRDESKCEPLRESLRDLFANTFTTEAFQAALQITFWGAAEEVVSSALERGESVSDQMALDWLEHYIGALNNFFDCRPAAAGSLKKVLGTFFGELGKDEHGATRVVKSSRNLKKIVVPGELKPDEWTKFRYILLELWGAVPEESFPDAELATYVGTNKLALRGVVMRNFEERELKAEAERRGVLTGDLSAEVRKDVTHGCRKAFAEALRRIGVSTNVEQLSKLVVPPPTGAADEGDEDREEAE